MTSKLDNVIEAAAKEALQIVKHLSGEEKDDDLSATKSINQVNLKHWQKWRPDFQQNRRVGPVDWFKP